MVIEYYIVKLDSLVVRSNWKWRIRSAVDDSLWHLITKIMSIFSFDFFISPLFICNQTTLDCTEDDIIA